MRVFVAGASGAIGTRLVPQLIDHGDEVIGTTRWPSRTESLRALGAEPVVLNLLDAEAVLKAVAEAEPDAIVHQATALSGVRFSRRLDRSFAATNRLRTIGTDALLAASREAGVRRFVAQSFASLRYAREGSFVKTEDDRLDPDPVPSTRETNDAMRYLDEAVTDVGGIVLRNSNFYGATNDGLVEPVRKRPSSSSSTRHGSGVPRTTRRQPARGASAARLRVKAAGTRYGSCNGSEASAPTIAPLLLRAVLGAERNCYAADSSPA